MTVTVGRWGAVEGAGQAGVDGWEKRKLRVMDTEGHWYVGRVLESRPGVLKVTRPGPGHGRPRHGPSRTPRHVPAPLAAGRDPIEAR